LLDLVDGLKLAHRLAVAELETAIKGDERCRIVSRDYLIFDYVDEGRHVVSILGFRHGRRRQLSEGDKL